MTFQRVEGRAQSQWVQPLVPTIDFDQAIWQAYLNCVNAYQTFQAMSLGAQGSNLFEARLATERFNACVNVLERMILPEWRDEAYKKSMAGIFKITKFRQVKVGEKTEKEWFQDFTGSGFRPVTVPVMGPQEYKAEEQREVTAYDKFEAITQLLHRNGFFKVKKVEGTL